MKFDCIVLGAGMVGVSAALHLQKRGRSVVLVDRRPAAEETSLGNAGIIQTEGVMPYSFPRDFVKILKYAINALPESRIHYSALPELAPWLFQYWRHGSAERVLRSAEGLAPIVRRALIEHEALIEEAGAEHLLRRNGYLRVWRSEAQIDAARIEQQKVFERFGVTYEVFDRDGLAELEPHIMGGAGGLHLTGPGSISDPEALGKAYAKLFVSRGGEFRTADAHTLEKVPGTGWQVQSVDGPIQAHDAVLALGIWSREVLKGLGTDVPLAAKRGYHMHYTSRGNATLSRPVLDADTGYMLAPMRKGVRLTTGAEFAPSNAPATPRQLDLVEPIFRKFYPAAERVDPQPWLGRRPCLPDMNPMIGEIPGHPGLWADFGHQHLGFTLGPVSGRLLAEAMTGEETFTDLKPYRADRF